MVTVEVFVRQDFIAELWAVLPVDNWLRNLPLQKRRDVFAVGNIFVVANIVPVLEVDVFCMKRIKEVLQCFLFVLFFAQFLEQPVDLGGERITRCVSE